MLSQFGLGRLGLMTGGGARFPFVNPEAAALVAAMSPQPDDTRKTLIDDTIGGWKADGVWTSHDGIWVLAAHAQQPATLNWKNPSTQLILFNSPTFTVDRGFTTNGIDSYLDTGFNPADEGTNFVQDSALFGTWRGDNPSPSGVSGGWLDATPDGVSVVPSNANDAIQFRINQGNTSLTANSSATDARGWTVANRISGLAAGPLVYKDGAAIAVNANPATTSTPVNDNNLLLGRSSDTVFNAIDIRVVAIGSSLAATPQADFYTTLNAYMTAVGAEVV